MLTLKCDIAIKRKSNGNIVRFSYANSINVKTSRDNLTDTAEIKVPRKMFWRGKPLYDFIAPGDSVCIKLGYAEMGNIETVFNGYLKSVETSTETTIKCENAMRLLKTIEVKAEIIKNFDLRAWVGKYTDMEVVQPDNTDFGTVTVQKQSLAQALDKIMKDFPYLKCYFDDHKLTFVINDKGGNQNRTHIFDPTRNMISDEITYTRAEDVKIAVKAVHINKDGTKLEYTHPKDTTDCEVRTWLCPSATNIDELKAMAINKQQEWVMDKVEGNITAFGLPFVRKNDIVKMCNPLKKEIDGKRFLVSGVDYNFTQQGYRQIITLGYQLK